MVKSLKEKEIKKEEDSKPVVAEVKEVVKPKVTPQTPKTVAKTEPPKVEKVVAPVQELVKTANDGAVATTGVYIQVGATSKLSPSKKFLNTIKSKNYEYRLLPISVNGKQVTKILVGPYANTTAAKKVIADVKANINKDAFIYRVK